MPRSAQVESVQTALNTASRRSETSLVALANAEDDLTIARESYRTALEAGKPVVALERRYRAADSAFRQAREKQRRTASDLARARGEFALVEDPFSNRVDRVDRERTLATMGLRVLFAMSLLGFGYWTLAALRRRRSRYLPLAFGILASGTLICLIAAGDYTTAYVDLRDVGPLVLSAAGIAGTLIAFFILQRYLARRIPRRRIRRGECPFCGYPAHGGAYCEGCGREVLADCSSCGKERRVGTAYCASCGKA